MGWLKRFFSGNYLYPALDIGTYSLKLLQLEKKGNYYEVVKKGSLDYKDQIFSGTELLDEYLLVEHIRELYETLNVTNKEVVVHIPLSMCFYNVISIPSNKEPEEAVVEYMKSILSPEEFENISLNYKVLPVSVKQGNKDIVIAAVKEDYIRRITNVLRIAKLKPIVIDIEPAAISNQYYLNNPNNIASSVCLVDIGASFTKIVVSFGGYPYVTRNIELAGMAITEQLQREFMLSRSEAEKLKRGVDLEEVSYSSAFKVICGVIRKIFTEVFWTIDNFKDRFDMEVSSIILFGGSAKIKGLLDFLKEISNLEVELGTPLKFSRISDSEEFAVAAGLSIRREGDEDAEI